MRLRHLAQIGLTAAVCLAATLASAAQVSVGAGSVLSLGSGELDLGCADLVVGGTLAGGTGTMDQVRDVSIQGGGTLSGESATLNVTGDWDNSNSGTFTAGTSTVNFVDGCERTSATISGSSEFYDVDLTTSEGKLYEFEEGQTTTVTDYLTLAGASGNLLTIRSTLDGNAAFFRLQGTSSADFVDVQDNDARPGNPISLGPNSVKGPNTPGWLTGIPVPTLGPVAFALLAALLVAASAFARRRRVPAG